MLGYILDDNNNVIAEPNIRKWSAWFERNTINRRRIVKQETVNNCWVSTVFLGLDHRFNYNGPNDAPLVFETMVFYPERCGCDVYSTRTTTWELALQEHQTGVTFAQNYIPPKEDTTCTTQT